MGCDHRLLVSCSIGVEPGWLVGCPDARLRGWCSYRFVRGVGHSALGGRWRGVVGGRVNYCARDRSRSKSQNILVLTAELRHRRKLIVAVGAIATALSSLTGFVLNLPLLSVRAPLAAVSGGLLGFFVGRYVRPRLMRRSWIRHSFAYWGGAILAFLVERLLGPGSLAVLVYGVVGFFAGGLLTSPVVLPPNTNRPTDLTGPEGPPPTPSTGLA